MLRISQNLRTDSKKFLVQEVRQRSDISDRIEVRVAPSALTSFAIWPLRCCATCKGSSYTKNEYNFFYNKLYAKYFLFDNFFEKNGIFRKNSEKLFRGIQFL